MLRAVAYLWILLLCARAGAEPVYSGSAACAGCHPSEARKHAASMHERALRRASESQASALLDRPVRERGGLEFTYTRTAQGLLASANKGSEKATLPIEWIFGAGTLAFTPVGRLDQTYVEHRVSWYSASQRPGMTLGHPPQAPVSVKAALGLRQTPEMIYRCFHCHATAVKPGPDLSAIQPGVQCERCHGPGSTHVQSPGLTNIKKLSGLSQKESVSVCGDCHRMPPGTQHSVPPEKRDAMSIRFAPLGLMASRCFQRSGSLTCVTCHDPHGGPRPPTSQYEQACRDCHAGTTASECPREANTSCLGCHMRKATPVPDLTFTDHRIRIYPAKN